MSTKIEINQDIVKQIFSREGIKIYYDKEDDGFWQRKWFHSTSIFFIDDMSKFKVKECSDCKYYSICMIIEYKNKFSKENYKITIYPWTDVLSIAK